jgi:hypothetical protein
VFEIDNMDIKRKIDGIDWKPMSYFIAILKEVYSGC